MTNPFEELRDAFPRLEARTGQARGVPAALYTDPEWFLAERAALFDRSWAALAFESDVPEIGDVAPIEFAGRSFILTRARDGVVRVFRNVCPHRGMRLLGEKKSRCGGLTCP